MLHAFVPAFTGTAVEFLETAVIAYAIARAGYVREAVSALVLGHVLVFALAVLLVPIQGVFPVTWLRLAAALLLTAMGLHWTQKSLRRWLAHQRPRWAEDPLASVPVPPRPSPTGAGHGAAVVAFSGFMFVVMLKSSVIEAIEILIVVFPVAAATSAWGPVLLGVIGGIVAVGIAVALLHGQMRRVPEVLLKLWTGVLLLALGLWWLIEFALEHRGGVS
jgi:uncharacterized membrane protein